MLKINIVNNEFHKRNKIAYERNATKCEISKNLHSVSE